MYVHSLFPPLYTKIVIKGKVPSLIEGMKDAGLLVMTWGSGEMLASLASIYEPYERTLDAILRDGVLTFLDHPKNKFG